MRAKEPTLAIHGLIVLVLAVTVGGCSDQGSAYGPVSDNNDSQSKVDENKIADAEVRKRCLAGIQLSNRVLSKGASMMSAVEDAHEPNIAKTQAAYIQTIGNPTYEISGEGVMRAMQIENEAKDAKIASLKEQQRVADALVPLEAKINKASHQEELGSISGSPQATGDVCASAVSLLTESKKSLRKVRDASKTARPLADDERELVEASLARIGSKRAGK